MSRVPDLGEKNANLIDVLTEYDAALVGVEDIILIEGKKLEFANMENSRWQSYYDQKKIELGTLTKYLEVEVYRVRSRLFRSYKENYSRTLSEREINQYINGEDEYLRASKVLLEVKELYDKYTSVVDAFTSRGYSLNNITKVRVAALEDVEL